ncbi:MULTISPECIES: GntR family transcriptional regulator [unclassified Pseudovibrio]|uniref:GntR family transcriptional regulator n=1 Tax=unclassified Pseudovibrio TaxID=2627060 RepID=UPI00070F616B|nr:MULTISPECIES: GntR family transcriptional regulator [unclassified Pseudovibrio]
MISTANNPLKIERPTMTLRDMALEKMRAAIIAGHFQSGDRLVERPLCDQLGVSRSVVRETIRYLEAEGLVEILPNKGPIVAKLDWENAQQIYEIRMLLETSAAQKCAELAKDGDKKKLAKALAQLKLAYSSGETNDLFEATTLFYQCIFDISGQNVAWEVVQRLNGRISRLRAMTLGTRDRHDAGYKRIEKIYSAIETNDPQAAAAAIQLHLTEAANIAKTLLTAELSKSEK